jgi:hypothetical protein
MVLLSFFLLSKVAVKPNSCILQGELKADTKTVVIILITNARLSLYIFNIFIQPETISLGNQSHVTERKT